MNRSLKFLPLALCLALSLSGHAQKFEKNGNVVTYRGNRFEFSKAGEVETQTITDPVTGKTVKKEVTKDALPVKMNKERIYNYDEVTLPPMPANGKEVLQVYVIKGVLNDLAKLPDNIYYIDLSNVIIDSKGKPVYYEYGGIIAKDNKTKVSADVKSAVDKKIDDLINRAPNYMPGKVNGYRVTVRTDIFYDTYKVQVKKHKAGLIH
jgi:hypothetical protein